MFLKYFKIIEAAKGCGLPSVHCGWQAFFIDVSPKQG